MYLLEKNMECATKAEVSANSEGCIGESSGRCLIDYVLLHYWSKV